MRSHPLGSSRHHLLTGDRQAAQSRYHFGGVVSSHSPALKTCCAVITQAPPQRLVKISSVHSSIQVTLELAEVELDLDRAVPCGLIINELVSNALKYAFPEQKGELYLRFCLEDTGNYCLIVKDGGIGIPAHINPQYTDSLGMQLVYGLTEQLGGEIELNKHKGNPFKITFRKMP